MSFTLSDRTQAIWFVEIPPGDWMAAIEALDDGRFRLEYRFRYDRDRDAFESQDAKKWYRVEAEDLAQGIEAVRRIISLMKLRMQAGRSYELLRGNLSTRDFMDLLMCQSFVHTKQVSEEEYKRHLAQQAPR
jgi:hypothetical protein